MIRFDVDFAAVPQCSLLVHVCCVDSVLRNTTLIFRRRTAPELVDFDETERALFFFGPFFCS